MLTTAPLPETTAPLPEIRKSNVDADDDVRDNTPKNDDDAANNDGGRNPHLNVHVVIWPVLLLLLLLVVVGIYFSCAQTREKARVLAERAQQEPPAVSNPMYSADAGGSHGAAIANATYEEPGHDAGQGIGLQPPRRDTYEHPVALADQDNGECATIPSGRPSAPVYDQGNSHSPAVYATYARGAGGGNDDSNAYQADGFYDNTSNLGSGSGGPRRPGADDYTTHQIAGGNRADADYALASATNPAGADYALASATNA